MEFTELPFDFPGQIFRSAMPYSIYDPHGELIQAFEEHHVSKMVVLADEDECRRRTGRDLLQIYRDKGFEVIHLPIRDFSVPRLEDVRETITKVIFQAESGSSVAVHCQAGIGRTGMFLAALAKVGKDYSSEQAIRWVRKYIPGAIEVPSQELFVREI
jgi:protein-tyrosine phosphatase